ncbi:response regulator [Ammoniphilus sp. YIM 78166]|uniref:response regulator transcription factor n=1 Tax=Ammoniphilus sp. YIM 78166 TaxID=1644106 RepID=UPI00106FCC58|nr:response regulator [Ammoniphilus sp. YIM 78166]
MYKLVIVDDDRIIRRGLSSISWEDYGYQLVGEAPDGERGLEVIAEERPHIVISDIKMPFMDGLEMSRIIKEKYPEIKVILLTGYDDFKFAQEAIKLRAYDYLLKPVDREVLIEKVKLASMEWENERKAEKQIKEGMPFLRQRFLKRLFYQQGRQGDLQKEMEFLGINLTGRHMAACLIKLDEYKQAEIMEKEMLKYCVFNIVEEILHKENHGLVYDSESDELIVLYTNDEEVDEARQGFYRFAEHIRENVSLYLKTTVTIALGRMYGDISEVALSYEEARSAIEFRHLIGKDQVFSIEDTGLAPNPTANKSKGLENELVLKVKLGLAQEVKDLLLNMHEQWREEKKSLHHVRLMALQLVVLLFREAEEWAKDWVEDHREDLGTHYHEIHELQTAQEIVAKLEETTSSLLSFVKQQRESQKNATVDKAMRYIEENFHQEGLSLQDVAKEVHISPTYLSILFKQDKNINFSEFVLETRMKKAMELLRQQNLKAYEVAEMVGYNNPQYFSVSFKKYTGYSPLDFKKQA